MLDLALDDPVVWQQAEALDNVDEHLGDLRLAQLRSDKDEDDESGNDEEDADGPEEVVPDAWLDGPATRQLHEEQRACKDAVHQRQSEDDLNVEGTLLVGEPAAQDELCLTEDVGEVQAELAELHLHVVQEVVVVLGQPRIALLSDLALATGRAILEHEGREQADCAGDNVRVEDVDLLEHPVGVDSVTSVVDLLVLDEQVVRVEDGDQVACERGDDANDRSMILHTARLHLGRHEVDDEFDNVSEAQPVADVTHL